MGIGNVSTALTKNMIMTKELKVASFFSGAMGMDLGLERAGLDTLVVCETDKHARETIKINRPGLNILGDINDVTTDDVLNGAGVDKFEVVVGGPPCQAFSTAGKRRGFDDDRGNVFLKFIELAIELLPDYLVIENVRGLLSAPYEGVRGGALYYIVKRLEEHYHVSFQLYNSANFGTPQTRERLIIICSRTSKVGYLDPTHHEDGLWELPEWKTFEDVCSDLEDCNTLSFPSERLKYFRMLGPGQNWKDLPEEYKPGAMGASYFSGGGKTGFYRRLAWDKPSPTLVTSPIMPATSLCHPEFDRPLSIEEYKRIQEFPDDWQLAGSLVHQYRQVGNAVPLGLGEAVGHAIRSHQSNIMTTDKIGFEYSRYKGTDDISWRSHFADASRGEHEKLM